MKANKKNERGATSVEYTCLLAMLCMVLIPIIVGNGEDVPGIAAPANQNFYWIVKEMKKANGGSEGTITIGGSAMP